MINFQDNNRHHRIASHNTQCENECHKNCSAIYSFHDKSFFLETSSDIYSFTYFCAMSVSERNANKHMMMEKWKEKSIENISKLIIAAFFMTLRYQKKIFFRSLVLLYWDYIFWQREIISSIFIFLLHKKYWEVSTEK